MDSDVRNTAITSELARLQGTELYHGITGRKRQSGLVMDIWGGRFCMITSLPNKKLFSLTSDNHFRVLPAQEQSELLLEAALPWMLKCIGRTRTKQV